ncbi:rRNA maturation RNase YbeY [Sulfurimonas sp. MAG313]|nr:rRNA maturation RNase YbeY [Sulfurimonas sp. MAG313]MDF1880460.1 rRNA maturation RNase YbeY [Sulfurimonas sp. MAG313]
MIDIDNQTKLHIPLTTIKNIAQSLTNKDIELLVVDSAYIQKINFEYRNIDKPTDVLSFPFEELPMGPLGSLIICEDFVISASKSFSHSQDDEFCLLFIHGLLHLLDFDHEVDNGEMRAKEKEIIQTFSLPESLIIRTLKD